MGITFLETSARQSINIDQAFINMANEIKITLEASEKIEKEDSGKIIEESSKKNKNKIKKCWRSWDLILNFYLITLTSEIKDLKTLVKLNLVQAQKTFYT